MSLLNVVDQTETTSKLQFFLYCRYDQVEADCTDALKLDPTYVKALMRRAAAREELGRLEDARSDLTLTLQLEPHNLQAQRDLARVKSAAVSFDLMFRFKEYF